MRACKTSKQGGKFNDSGKGSEIRAGKHSPKGTGGDIARYMWEQSGTSKKL